MQAIEQTKQAYLVFDDIIYWLQAAGGITTYWNEVTSRICGTSNHVYRIGFDRQKLSDVALDVRPTNAISERMPPGLGRYLSARVPSFDGQALFHSSYYRRSCNKTVATVVTVHDFTYERFRRGIPRAVHSWQKLSAIRAADMVICVSEHTRKDLFSFCPETDSSKIVVIPHGVSDKFTPPRQDSSFPQHPHPYVLYVGDRSSYKRFDLAVEAVSGVPELRLFIVGGTLSLSEEQLLEESIAGRWEFKGRVSLSELNRLYNSAFALIYPSDYEGFGFPVLEAMRSGCPVVSASSSSLPQVGGSAALFAEEQRAHCYSQQLVTLFDSQTRTNYVRLGLAHSARFTWENCVEQTLNTYERAIARHYG